MDDHEHQSTDVSGFVASANARWQRADRGWRAVLLAGAVLAAVRAGVKIPW